MRVPREGSNPRGAEQISFDPGVFSRLRAEACAALPREAAGLLLGPSPDRVTDAVPLTNHHPGTGGFIVHHSEVEALLPGLEARGFQVLGLYHSHADHDASCSAADARVEGPGGLMAIFGTIRGYFREARIYRLTGGQARELRLVVGVDPSQRDGAP